MFNIVAIPAFNDNYIWCIIHPQTKHCVLVDPGDATVCIDYISEHQLTLDAILVTHHHSDHVGGLTELSQYCQQQRMPLTVFGPDNQAIQGIDVTLNETHRVALFDNSLEFEIFAIPGHTLDHIAYYSKGMLFCGDTLFSGGCGRLFEGSPDQMLESLTKLASLPDDTKVYCAHEYTLANLEFARTIDENNSQLKAYYDKVVKLRAKGRSTIPSSIGLEKQINPFLRSNLEEIKNKTEQKTSNLLPNQVAVFANIRQLKDKF
ncbi:hydroxyacylglutathione hydrolase [Thalassotalea aquiviva]|uniref:hydroxyacylglutathione hydrolase n=1 Tax=Thalassotalea aquiviva TaxID=3242415 RepID=UPI003529D5B3